MNTITYIELAKAISFNRLQTYHNLPNSYNNQKTIENYIYNIKLSENFYILLQNLEVTLRNSIYDSYCNNSSFSRNFFYIREQNTTRHYNREYHSYACWKMIGTVKYHLNNTGISPTDGKIIAALNFGFWTTLLEENHYKTLIWRKIFRDVFPNYTLAGSIDNAIDDISIKINKVRNFRNRIFHYEPILNQPNLDEMNNNILEIIGWINPKMRELSELFNDYQTFKSERKRISNILKTIDNNHLFNKRTIKKIRNKKRK